MTKLNSDGSALVYSTYLGCNGLVAGYGIAVDTAGNAYVTGQTYCSDFPITPGSFQSVQPGNGSSDAFAVKLNATGSALVYSTYLGGSNSNDMGYGIAVDASGNAYVTGGTDPVYSGTAPNFPTTPGAFQTTYGGCIFSGGAIYGGFDAFVSKLNATGSALVYSTYLGGAETESGNSIAVDSSGNAYVTRGTTSSNFPTTGGAFQTTFGGGSWLGDVFVSKLNAAGSALVYSTYLGGTDEDLGDGIAIDASGNAYVTGTTSSYNFPTTPGGFQTTYHGGGDAFVTKLNGAGSALVYSTYLGGSGDDCRWSCGIAVDASGNAYVTGMTESPDFPITPGAFQTTYSGGGDIYVATLDASGSAFPYSTYLGGKGGEYRSCVVVDRSGDAYVTGWTMSTNFPITTGAFQPALGGGDDAFVTKLSLGSAPMTRADLGGPPGNNGWYLGLVKVTLIATPRSSPVSATYYSVDGGPYLGFGAPFAISTDGTHQLVYYSVDTAGDQETPHGQTIKIDATKPVSHVTALHATASSPNFSVRWSGTDATSGLANYTIYVSDNGGPFAPGQSKVTSPQAYYVGSLLHTYGFYSIAADNAGNQESKTTADATTHVPQMPGDVNGDGKINCADIALVKAAFGTRTGQPGFNASADVNHDGVVNVLDLAIVSQKLIPGTKCP